MILHWRNENGIEKYMDFVNVWRYNFMFYFNFIIFVKVIIRVSNYFYFILFFI